MDFGFVKIFAGQIVSQFGTDDVLAIAEKAGVKIVYQKWFPVTIGEFDGRTRTICVNLNTSEAVEKIVAHELGHFFAADLELSLELNKEDEEIFARQFAEYLTARN